MQAHKNLSKMKDTDVFPIPSLFYRALCSEKENLETGPDQVKNLWESAI